MGFKPFGSRYAFDKSVLVKDFPDYLLEPIIAWIYDVMRSDSLLTPSSYSREASIDQHFRHSMQLQFHETFPAEWSNFIHFATGNTDRLCNLLAYLLQIYVVQYRADKLEHIFRSGSSAYTVGQTRKDIGEYDVGVYDLRWYVPSSVQMEAEEALNANDLLLHAWDTCYKRDADPAECVRLCNDFLEGYLRDKYWPGEERTPSLSVAIKKLEQKPDTFKFKGDTFNSDKLGLLQLLSGISQIRGEHQTGAGRAPTQAEAEYVLHTTIYIWNLTKDL